MPTKPKYRRKSRKPRKTTRRKYMPKGKGGTFRSKVKKALMSMSETKSIGRVMDEYITLGNTSASWLMGEYILPVNNASYMLIQQGTGANERIGNRIEFKSVRIPMYITNQTPETLRIRVMVCKKKTNLPLHPYENHLFMDPLGKAEQFNHVAPWQADWPVNKEVAHVVKQRTFNLNGSIDWGAQTTGFPGHRPIQFTGNSGIKKLEMGFKLKKKHYFDDYGAEINNMDQYLVWIFVWRLNNNTIPYELNHNLEGLGNLSVKQFHKVYFTDI